MIGSWSRSWTGAQLDPKPITVNRIISIFSGGPGPRNRTSSLPQSSYMEEKKVQ